MLAVDIDLVLEGLRVLHIVGLCIGFGGVVLSDLLILQALSSHTRPEFPALYARLHKPALIGLALVGVSGVALAGMKHDLQALPQPLAVKLALALVIAVNLYLVGNRFRAALAVAFDGSNPRLAWRPSIALMAMVGVSATAWLSALFVSKLTSFKGMDPVTTAQVVGMLFVAILMLLAVLVVMLRITAVVRERFGWQSSADEVGEIGTRNEEQHFVEELVEEQPVMARSFPLSTVGGDRREESGDEQAIPSTRKSPQQVSAPYLRALRYFGTHAPGVLVRLARAAHDRRSEDVIQAAYTLKSMSHVVHAKRLASVCARFEADASNGVLNDVRARLVELKTEMTKVLEFIETNAVEAPLAGARYDPHPSPIRIGARFVRRSEQKASVA